MSASKSKSSSHDSPSKGSKKSTGLMTPPQQFAAELASYYEKRKSTIPIAQEIVNLRNQSSYGSNVKVTEAIGPEIKPSTFLMYIHESLSARIKQLEEIQDEMLRKLEKAATILYQHEHALESAAENPDSAPVVDTWPVDLNYTRNVMAQLKQQMFLELSAAATISMAKAGTFDEPGDEDPEGDDTTRFDDVYTWDDDITIDPDVAATLLLCFTHPPYLAKINLETFAASF